MLARRQTAAPIVLTPSSPRKAIAEPSVPDFPLTLEATEKLVRAALMEDKAFKDITTAATVLSDRRARGAIVARERGVIAGMPLALASFRLIDRKVAMRVDAGDGALVKPTASVLFLNGRARAILSAERVALNFLQHLSGIATATRRFVDAVAGTGVRIMDTRKTTPGWRALEKYAVRAGGGFNHRMDLGESVLIKDNHIAAVGGDIQRAVQRARKMAGPGTRVEVECESSEQVEAAVAAGADVIMLDNMPMRSLAASVKIAKGHAVVEASGGISLDNVRAVAEAGVDWISVGSITHSAPAMDLALDLE
jgi:nicotinate-nucleotide pyrophosphorylase (carboxylating)